jgi:methylase of polypeptide subunit release factors
LAATALNARLNHCEFGLRVLESNLFEKLDRKYGLIVSNPPTFPHPEHNGIESGISQAFFAGKNGRDFVDVVANNAAPFLIPRGRLLLLVPSYLDPKRTLDMLRSTGLLGVIPATLEVSLDDYVRNVASYGLDADEMINAAFKESRVNATKHPFKLDRGGQPVAFQLSLIMARKPD